MNESCHIQMGRCTYKWVMSHLTESCRISSHRCLIHMWHKVCARKRDLFISDMTEFVRDTLWKSLTSSYKVPCILVKERHEPSHILCVTYWRDIFSYKLTCVFHTSETRFIHKTYLQKRPSFTQKRPIHVTYFHTNLPAFSTRLKQDSYVKQTYLQKRPGFTQKRPIHVTYLHTDWPAFSTRLEKDALIKETYLQKQKRPGFTQKRPIHVTYHHETRFTYEKET